MKKEKFNIDEQNFIRTLFKDIEEKEAPKIQK